MIAITDLNIKQIEQLKEIGFLCYGHQNPINKKLMLLIKAVDNKQ